MAFPTTPVLDNFDRADSGSLGANWSSPIESGFGALDIISNQAGSAATFEDSYWSTQFAADQEAHVVLSTMTAGTTSAQLYCRLQSPGGSFNGYKIQQDGDGHGALAKIVGGTVTFLGSGWIAGSVVAGNKIGLACVGTTITAYKFSGGSWSVLESLTDSAISGAGFIGLQIRGESVTRYDDFGGGTIPIVRSPQLDYDYSR